MWRARSQFATELKMLRYWGKHTVVAHQAINITMIEKSKRMKKIQRNVIRFQRWNWPWLLRIYKKKRRLYSIYRIVRSNQLNMVLKPFIYHSTTWNAFSVSFCTIFGFVIVFIVCDLRNCVAVSFCRDVFVSLHFYYLVRNVVFFCLLLCYLFKTEISLFDVRNQFALYVHIVCMCKYVCVYVCFSHSAFISDSSIMSSIVFE